MRSASHKSSEAFSAFAQVLLASGRFLSTPMILWLGLLSGNSAVGAPAIPEGLCVNGKCADASATCSFKAPLNDYVEFQANNPTYNGNAFDLTSTVSYEHKVSGQKKDIEMFYDGGTTWKYRFTGTETGVWTYTTSSSDPQLDGLTGCIDVTPSSRKGFLTSNNNKWMWSGTGEVFVPQLAMTHRIPDFKNNQDLMNSEVKLHLIDHGFTGLHLENLAGNWFSIDGDMQTSTAYSSPDRKTFETLETFVTKAYHAGGMVHIWAWGSQNRSQTPETLSGGFNGTVDRRLQRYIAARLGAVPGWSMGYGWDLNKWVTANQLTTWHDYMQNRLDWSHPLGGRPEGPNAGLDHAQFNSWNRNLDYASYEHHSPTYEVYRDAILTNPNKTVLSEDRFRIRVKARQADKDYDEEKTRRGLYHSTMAGGVGNIWGYLGDIPEGATVYSQRYPNIDQLKTYATFFFDRKRFLASLSVNNSLSSNSNTRVLKSSDNKKFIFYRENTKAIQMRLGSMVGTQKVVAVDTQKKYAEIAVGSLNPGSSTWTAPYSSDWIIAVGAF
jgi:hypothetical protein